VLRAIVFDLDDTLYPERTYVESGFRAVADWAGRTLGLAAELVHGELMGSFEDGIRGDTFDRLLARHGVVGNGWVRQMVDVYRGHAPEIAPFPGVMELLPRLRARFLLGLVTDGQSDVQRRKLRALGLNGMFHAIVLTDDLGRRDWKPSSRPFAAVLDMLGVPGPEATYIGDNPEKDFLGARRIGMRSIWIRHSNGLYAGLRPPSPEHAPVAEVHSFEELEALLGAWHGTGPAVHS